MSDVPEMASLPKERTTSSGVRWFALVLFIAQLALLVIGIAALWRIGGGWWLGAAAGGLFALAYIAVWYFVLAPGSRWRLAYRERLLIHLVQGPAIVVLGGLSQLWLPALITLSMVVLCDSLDERRSI